MAEQNKDQDQSQETPAPKGGEDTIHEVGLTEASGPSDSTVNGHASEMEEKADVPTLDGAKEEEEENGGDDKIQGRVENAATGVSSDLTSEAGQADSETKEKRSAVSNAESSLTPSDCSSLLRGIFETLIASVSATNSLQKTTEKGFTDFQKLASRLVDKVEETNNILRNLVKQRPDTTARQEIEKTEQKASYINALRDDIEEGNKFGPADVNSANLQLSAKDNPQFSTFVQDHKSSPERNKEGPRYYDSRKSGLDRIIIDPTNVPGPLSSSDFYSSDDGDSRPDIISEVGFSREVNEDSLDVDEKSLSSDKKQPSKDPTSLLTNVNNVGPNNVPPDPKENQKNKASEQPQEKKSKESGAVNSSSQNSRSQTEPAPKDARPKEKPSPTMGSDSSSSTYSVQMPEPRLHSGRSGRKSRNRDQSKISALGLSIFSSGETESKRLHNALERARAPDPNPAPKARSFDTVLCLDTSASMLQGGALEQMKKAAIEFVNGVEDVVNDTGVEENIGIVTFGGFSNIVQHLTNDFARVRDAVESMAIKGKSPFFEAMVVCLAAFDGRGGTVSVSGEYDVHPRIVFITDGHITECTDDPYGPDRVHDPTNTRAGFSRLMMDLSPQKNPSMPHPILFVPVGSRADRNFLESMAKLNDSHLVEADMITSLCNYFRVQETIGKVIVCLHNKDTDSSDGQIEAVVRALVPDIKSHEMREVLSTVKEELKQPSRKKSQRTNPTDFDEVHEDTEGVDRGERLPLGTRVKRGPDWKWGDQDGGGAGTVVQHEDNKHPFTWVLWDSGEWNRYPYGAEMGYHVWKTEEHPVLRRDGGELEIGMIVRKGSKWNQPDRDDYPGVVIRKSRGSKRVKVRWQSGQITACPADTVEFKEKEREKRRVSPIREEEFHSDDGQDDENKIRAWQWMDDWGDWHLYTQEQNRLLEKSFQRSKTGTCLVERSGKQFRVLFRKKVERDVSKGLERDVHRVLLPRDEYASLLLAEELMCSNH